MNSGLLTVYHRLPPVVRSGVATARGFYLRGWRYGRHTERTIAEALERDHWTANQLHEYQRDRLAAILERAATRVPYYRDYWQSRGRGGDRLTWGRLENWPVLEKASVQAAPERFVADDCDTRRMFTEQTSGTTGTPLRVWHSRETVQTWYALAEARWRRWYGVSRNDRWAMIGGQLVAPVSSRKPPFWVWNGAMRQLYMSSFHLEPGFMGHYLAALSRYRVRYLFGYTSSLYSLAREVLRLGRTDLSMKVVITNAEPALLHQRRAISEAFGCPVRETYGMAEFVTAMSECEEGHMHVWPEPGLVEVLRGDDRVSAGESGDLTCTSLLNADMPLIRYRVGDRAVLGETERCACGRTLPRVAALEGRCDDVVITTDGRCLGRLDPVFKDDLPLREAQIIQEQLDRFRIRYVPGPGFQLEIEALLAKRLRDYVGPVNVTMESVERIPRTRNGKFRAVVSRLSKETIDHARSRSLVRS